MSYGMPAYADDGALAYFALAKKHIGLYVIPPVIADHKALLKDYVTTKSALQMPLDVPLPIALIKKLVRASLTNNRRRTKAKAKARATTKTKATRR